METILVIDVDVARADFACDLLAGNQVPARACLTLPEILQSIEASPTKALILAHCDLLNESFGILAQIVHHPKVKIFFFCTDDRDRCETIAQFPQELARFITKVLGDRSSRCA
jgi:hypothetical protein